MQRQDAIARGVYTTGMLIPDMGIAWRAVLTWLSLILMAEILDFALIVLRPRRH